MASKKTSEQMNTEKVELNGGTLFQIIVFLNTHVRVGFHHEQRVERFYSPQVFMDEVSAQNAAVYFITLLIKDGSIPENAIVDGKTNEDVIKVGLYPLQLSTLEKLDEDESQIY